MLNTRFETLGFEGTRLRILVAQAKDAAAKANEQDLLAESFQTLSILPDIRAQATAVAIKSRDEDVTRIQNSDAPGRQLSAVKARRGDVLRKMEGLGLISSGQIPKYIHINSFLEFWLN